MHELTAFVLAGGKSTRMGTDKAFLRWHDQSLLEYTLKLAHELTPEVRIVGEAEKFAGHGVEVIEDIYRGRGPLGGIHAALQTTASPWNLLLAVDLPLLNRQLLSYLVTRARESDALVTVPNTAGGLQPLCAVYRREFGEIAGRSLRAGKNKIDLLFPKIRTQIIAEDELLRAGFSPQMFWNVNTPQDLEAVKRRSGAEA